MQRTMNTKTLTLVLAAGAITSAANAQISFGPRTDLPTAQRPAGVAAGDFTGDGLMDLAVVVDNPDRVLIMAGDGAGGFAAGPVTFLGAGVGADAAEAHDIDGDGDQDLVVIFDNTSSAQILLNDGAGNFAPGGRAATGAEPVWIAKGRLNANPGADFVIVNRDSNSVTILLDFGVSTVSSTLAVGAEPRAAAIGDYNGDGNADLAVTNHDSRSIGIYTGNGAGGFVAGQVITTPGQRPEGIVSADFDGDGDADLAATVDDFMQVYRNDAGAFSFAGRVAVGSFDPSEMYVGNFAPGGAGPDVMTVNNDGGSVSVFENLGGLAFSAALVLPTGVQPEFAAIADFDGSGSSDIAVTNRDSNTTSVFINDAVVAPPCRADFDGDGSLTIFDFLAFQTAFAMGNPRADIDGDGSLTIFDFLAFQNLFVAGCP
ncbi:MAG: FG-GAP-like repeat-containing protein [Phycisphaera sp.]|nr:MAG: FG-GAP-like repeat-containing protein [Phycisphaera sp.]